MSSETATYINNTQDTISRKLRQKEIFDPRIIDVEDSSKALWTTESVELANKGLLEGYKLRENPYLKTVKGALLRKANLPFRFTDDEIEIMSAVIDDKEFFADNFGKLKDGEDGWQNITLRDYQRNLLKRYDENRWNIIMFPRQSGKTTTTVLEIVHFCISNFDKDVVVIAQSDIVVTEILTKIKEAFSGLPFFMQPGFINFTQKGFALDNGCRLSIGIASESVVQGFALDFLYIDEFAYIKPSMVSKFWTNIYPSLINNPKSKCIITSTPNGRNMFWEMWKGAELKRNKFIPYRIYWHDVPGRDEQFKIDTIANVGIEGWEMGFECSFDTQLKSIFHSTVQKLLRNYQLENENKWVKSNSPYGEAFGMEFVSQDVCEYNLKTDWFVLGVDISEGLEQDATIAKLRKVEWSIEKQKLVYKSVGLFRSDTIAVEDFAKWIMNFSKLFDKNKLRIAIENNTYGGELFAHITSARTHDPAYSFFDSIILAKFHRKSKDDFEYGIRWNLSNKKTAVKTFSNLISDGTMIETNYMSIEEYLNFGRRKNGTYGAQYGHDDIVMADVTTSHFIKSTNVYSKEFLDRATLELRILVNDEDKIAKQKKDEEERRRNNVYKNNGFVLRNHDEEYGKNNPSGDNIYLFDFN